MPLMPEMVEHQGLFWCDSKGDGGASLQQFVWIDLIPVIGQNGATLTRAIQ